MKTKICRFHAKGGCSLGARCRFAHISDDATSMYMANNVMPSTVSAEALNNKETKNRNTETWTNEIERAYDDPMASNYKATSPLDTAPYTPRSSALLPSDNAELNIETSPSINYQGMSPNNTPPYTPRTCQHDTEASSEFSNEGIETSPTTINYQGMSPDNTPPPSPRAFHTFPEFNKVRIEMGHWSVKKMAEDRDLDPPTPDPVMAWKMQQDTRLAVAKLMYQKQSPDCSYNSQKAPDMQLMPQNPMLGIKEDACIANVQFQGVQSIDPFQRGAFVRPTWANLALGSRPRHLVHMSF